MPTLALMYWVRDTFMPEATLAEFREEWMKLTTSDRKCFEEEMNAEKHRQWAAENAARAATRAAK